MPSTNPSIPPSNSRAGNPASATLSLKRKRVPTEEEMELALLEATLEAAWTLRTHQLSLPTTKTAAQREAIRDAEMTTYHVLSSGGGQRYRAARKYLKARMVLVRFDRELAGFLERKGWA